MDSELSQGGGVLVPYSAGLRSPPVRVGWGEKHGCNRQAAELRIAFQRGVKLIRETAEREGGALGLGTDSQ